MEGTNSNGRRVSLLNVGPSARPGLSPLVQTRAPTYPRNGSYSAASQQQQQQQQPWSPAYSPRTPDLLRSDSWSSSQHTNPSSPATPHSSYEDMDTARYRSLSNVDNADYYQAGLPELSDPDKSQKKRHPCGLAAKTGCDKMFTTSGHAARHAKVHTGEKDTPCPDCGKYFARVDNMKQHLKTHKKEGGSLVSRTAAAIADSRKSKGSSSSTSRSDKGIATTQSPTVQYTGEAKSARPGMPQRANNAYSYQVSYSSAQAPTSPYSSMQPAGGLEALASACQISR
ncbi:MAG: hypothetical protein M1814_004171 [Vezdaea aestivalis]|nr:MAG: hypothetical protein M1814_004171 [Vezdaea aestivalis]